jgi:hypothetical protein
LIYSSATLFPFDAQYVAVAAVVVIVTALLSGDKLPAASLAFTLKV